MMGKNGIESLVGGGNVEVLELVDSIVGGSFGECYEKKA